MLNPMYDPGAVPAPSAEALSFHRALEGYAPTPLRDLGDGVWLKDESARLGLPAFKVLGVSWAVERVLRADPGVRSLVAASAGNHGRAVAHVAARRGLVGKIFLPSRAVPARREAIAGEGAEVVVVDGTYEDAVAQAAECAAEPGVVELADVGSSEAAHWVIDGYATLFAEIEEAWRAAGPGGESAGPGAARPGGESAGPGAARPAGASPRPDVLIVPVGVGSLAAAAARWGAAAGVPVIGAEPATAACLTAALEAGEPVTIPTPGTTMAGLDCAVVSDAAWSSLRAGIRGTVTVTDEQTWAAMRELAARGLRIGDSGAAPLAALHRLRSDPAYADLRAAVRLDTVVLVATEGVTDPEGYAARVP